MPQPTIFIHCPILPQPGWWENAWTAKCLTGRTQRGTTWCKNIYDPCDDDDDEQLLLRLALETFWRTSTKQTTIRFFRNTNQMWYIFQNISSGAEERGSVWADHQLYNCYCHTSPQPTGLSEVMIVGQFNFHTYLFCNWYTFKGFYWTQFFSNLFQSVSPQATDWVAEDSPGHWKYTLGLQPWRLGCFNQQTREVVHKKLYNDNF